MQDSSQNRIHFYNLDVLRFVAAMMVVIYHGYLAYFGWYGHPAFLTNGHTNTLSTIGEYTTTAVHNFDLGVEFFFLISGFLITYLLLHERQHSGRIHIGKFYLRRILRIWPLYFFIVALAPWWVNYCNEPQPDYMWTALFANNFHTIHTGLWQFPFAHFWSVCVEEHFYLVWPLLMAMVPVKKMPYLFVGIILLSMGFRVYVLAAGLNVPLQLYLNTLSRMDVLAIGAWMAYLHFKRPLQFRAGKWMVMLVYAAILVAFCTLYSKQWEVAPDLINVLLWKYIFVLAFVFVFCHYLFNPNAFMAFKKKNVLHYLGKVSYGMYMYHNLLFTFIITRFMWTNQTQNFAFFFAVYLILVIGLSVLSYEIIEKPFLLLKEKMAVVHSRKV